MLINLLYLFPFPPIYLVNLRGNIFCYGLEAIFLFLAKSETVGALKTLKIESGLVAPVSVAAILVVVHGSLQLILKVRGRTIFKITMLRHFIRPCGQD